jgi:hypothetical protein
MAFDEKKRRRIVGGGVRRGMPSHPVAAVGTSLRGAF